MFCDTSIYDNKNFVGIKFKNAGAKTPTRGKMQIASAGRREIKVFRIENFQL
jgi:hypothetical protein